MSLLDKASLVVTPNAYKESKLYSVIPSDGSGDMTVVRATTGTRINSAGLVEVVPRNLLTDSDGLITTYPTRGGNIVQAATPINGFVNSVEFQNNLTASFLYKTFGTTSGTTYSISAFVQMNDNSAPNPSSNNTSGDFSLLISGEYATNLNVERIGTSNVYRVSGRFTSINVNANYGVIKFTGQSAKAFKVTGYQLDLGTTATEYFPTTTRLNIPRIDYTNGSCPSLLVEPQRSNLLTYSEQFDDASWSKANATITTNTTISPSGVQNADTITSVSYPSTSVGKTNTLSATNHTLSCFVKASSVSSFRLDLVTAGYALGGSCIYNLTTLATTITNYGATTGTTAKIENVGNGWYRCSLTVSATAVVYFSQLYPAANGTIFTWGAQLEASSYPTSYIPTVASSVTRNAEVISKSGISSLIGQTEGTLFLDFYFKTPQSNVGGQIALKDNTGNNRVIIWNNFSLNTLGVQLKANASNIINNTSLGTFVNNQRYKIAIAYKSGDCAVYLNGSLAFQNTTSFTFSSPMTDLVIGAYELSFLQEGHQLNNSTQLYKTRLTNTELAQLTTL